MQPSTFPHEYVIDHVVGHDVREDGSVFYRIRWYGYSPASDPLEPIEHIPRSQILRYHRRTRTEPPTEGLSHAMVGMLAAGRLREPPDKDITPLGCTDSLGFREAYF